MCRSWSLCTQVLRGLSAGPLPQLDLGTVDKYRNNSYTLSALPLWAFYTDLTSKLNFAQSPDTPAQVQLHNVTLVLPQSDYAALLAAALRGPDSWKLRAVSTHDLMAGDSVQLGWALTCMRACVKPGLHEGLCEF